MKRTMTMLLVLPMLFLLFLCSCDHNVYLDQPDKLSPSLWKVNDKFFDTLQEAMDYIYGSSKGLHKSKAIDDVPVTSTAVLQRNVCNGERGGGLRVPADYSGKLVVDFNSYTYEFDDSLDHFFEILGGSEVYIINGTTVIYNEADHKPFALAVNTKTVTIDDHLIDDRRWDPANNKSDAKLFDVGEKGVLKVSGIEETEDTSLTGVISVVTDGTTGGKLFLDNSRVVVTNILTRYKNSKTGEISDSIPEETTIPNDARTDIEISSGHVTINNIETLSDYYKKEGNEPAELYSKAILNIFSDDTVNLTKIENPHDSTDKPIDTAIQTIIDDQNTVTDPDVDHVIIHNFDEDHTHPAVEPTCTTDGNIYYVQCTFCNHFFDKDGKQLSDNPEDDTEHNGPVIPKLGHISPLEHIAAVAATCNTTGNIEHWHCSRCNSDFSDAEGITEITHESTILPIDASNHNIVEVPAVAPECTESGHIQYWVCSRCGDFFADQEGTTKLSEEDLTKPVAQGGVIIPAIGHSPKSEYEYDTDYHWHVCEHDESHILDKESHSWDEGQIYDNGQHFVYTCTVCGAKYSVSEEEYQKYNIGIGTLLVPTGMTPSPSGDMVISREGDVCTITYSPHLNSAMDYTIRCRYMYNGMWSSDLIGTSDEYGGYTVTLIGILPYKIEMQVYNTGGTIVRQQTVSK